MLSYNIFSQTYCSRYIQYRLTHFFLLNTIDMLDTKVLSFLLQTYILLLAKIFEHQLTFSALNALPSRI
jgi:hypothetical protein